MEKNHASLPPRHAHHHNSSPLRTALDWMIIIGLGLTLGHTAWWIGGFKPIIMAEVIWMLGGLLGLHALAIAYTAIQKEAHINIDIITYVPFLLYGILSLWFITPVPWLGNLEWLLFFQAFIVCWLTVHHAKSTAKIITLCILLGLMGAMEVGAASYQYFIKPYWLPMDLTLPIFQGRSSGTLATPNQFAGLMLLLFFPCVIGTFWKSFSARIRLCFLIGSLLFGFGLLLAASRGAWLSMILTLFFVPLLLTRSYTKRWIAWATIILLLIITRTVLYENVALYKTREDHTFRERAFATRAIMWEAAWKIFNENPLTGTGIASYTHAFEEFRPPHFNRQPKWAHNEYLNILSDYGMFGFTLLFGSVAWVGFRSIRTWRHYSFGDDDLHHLKHKFALGALGLGVIAFGLHATFNFPFRSPIVLFTASVFVGLLVRFFHTHLAFMPRGYTFALTYLVLGIGIAAGIPVWATDLYRSATLTQDAEKKIETYINNPNVILKQPYYLFELVHQLQQAQKLDPNNAEIDNLLSRAYYYQALDWDAERDRHANLAAHHAAQAVYKNNQDARYWTSYGLALWLQGDMDQSGSCFNSAKELAPNNAQTWYYYAYYLSLDKARPDLALKAAERAIWLDPLNHKARGIKAKVEKWVEK